MVNYIPAYTPLDYVLALGTNRVHDQTALGVIDDRNLPKKLLLVTPVMRRTFILWLRECVQRPDSFEVGDARLRRPEWLSGFE